MFSQRQSGSDTLERDECWTAKNKRMPRTGKVGPAADTATSGVSSGPPGREPHAQGLQGCWGFQRKREAPVPPWFSLQTASRGEARPRPPQPPVPSSPLAFLPWPIWKTDLNQTNRTFSGTIIDLSSGISIWEHAEAGGVDCGSSRAAPSDVI